MRLHPAVNTCQYRGPWLNFFIVALSPSRASKMFGLDGATSPASWPGSPRIRLEALWPAPRPLDGLGKLFGEVDVTAVRSAMTRWSRCLGLSAFGASAQRGHGPPCGVGCRRSGRRS